MMKLRIECLKYGSNKPEMDYSYGSLKFDIPQVTLQNLLEQGFISEIAKLLVVSERTVYRRMGSFSVSRYNFFHQFLIKILILHCLKQQKIIKF